MGRESIVSASRQRERGGKRERKSEREKRKIVIRSQTSGGRQLLNNNWIQTDTEIFFHHRPKYRGFFLFFSSMVIQAAGWDMGKKNIRPSLSRFDPANDDQNAIGVFVNFFFLYVILNIFEAKIIVKMSQQKCKNPRYVTQPVRSHDWQKCHLTG